MIILLKFLQFCFRIVFFAPAGIALNIMYFCAWLLQAVAKRTRLKKIVSENIKLVLPPASPRGEQTNAEQTADRLIKNISYSIFEVLCIPFFRKKHFASIFRWKGLENLDKALQDKKGAILLTMHAGNYESVVPALSHRGFRLNAVLRATDDPLFAIVNRSRGTGGARLINILEEDMYKTTQQALGRNEIVYLLADTGALESRYEMREFLGRKVPVATGWLTLAQRAECPVVPVLAKREGKTNVITFYKPVKVTKDTREQALRETSAVFEEFIRKNPDHWAIFLNTYETKRMVEGK